MTCTALTNLMSSSNGIANRANRYTWIYIFMALQAEQVVDGDYPMKKGRLRIVDILSQCT